MKLNSAIALGMIEAVEALNAQIEAVYANVRQYDGLNNDRVIQDAVCARKAQREAAEEAESLIGSFDFVEEPE